MLQLLQIVVFPINYSWLNFSRILPTAENVLLVKSYSGLNFSRILLRQLWNLDALKFTDSFPLHRTPPPVQEELKFCCWCVCQVQCTSGICSHVCCDQHDWVRAWTWRPARWKHSVWLHQWRHCARGLQLSLQQGTCYLFFWSAAEINEHCDSV